MRKRQAGKKVGKEGRKGGMQMGEGSGKGPFKVYGEDPRRGRLWGKRRLPAESAMAGWPGIFWIGREVSWAVLVGIRMAGCRNKQTDRQTDRVSAEEWKVGAAKDRV